MMAEVGCELTHEKFKLVNLVDNITKLRLNTKFNQEIKTAKRKKEAFDSMFLPAQKPDISSAITKYLKSPATRNLYENLQHMAEDEKKVPTSAEVNFSTCEMGKRPEQPPSQ